MSLRLFDGHCDTAFALWCRQTSLRENNCHIDLNRAKPFSCYAQVFAFCSYAGDSAFAAWTPQELLLLPLSKFQEEIAQNAETIAIVQTKDEIIACNAAHQIAALLSVEGAEVIDCDPERLPWLRQQGFCMTTLTWNQDNALAGMHGSDLGLTDRGRAFVRQAQENRMIIDVSHLSDRAFWDLTELTDAPIIASHSNCRRLRNVSRNLTDDQLRAIAQTGGTVGLNLYADFLAEHPTYSDLLAQLEHMLHLCGEDHVALGGDLDGCDLLPDGFSDLTGYVGFYQYLSDAGYAEDLLDRIFYRNLLKLF